MQGLGGFMFPRPPVGFYFDVRIVEDALSNPATASPMGIIAGAAQMAAEAGFQEVSGLSAEIQTEEITEGGENRFVYKVPKQVRYPNLQLKRGVVLQYSAFHIWCDETIFQASFPVKPKMVVVTLMDVKHLPIAAWKFEKAYPVKYEVSGFNSENNQLLIENMELAYHRFEKVLSEASMALNSAMNVVGL